MAEKKNASLETVVAWAKRRGFVYPGSEIYGGLANARDLGPYGAQLRKNILDAWWKFFVQQQPNIHGIESTILMHPRVREASGHVAGFNDPLIDDKKTGQRFRADKLIEDFLERKIKEKAKKSGVKNEAAALGGMIAAIGEITAELAEKFPWIAEKKLKPEVWTHAEMTEFVRENFPKNPETGAPTDWTEVRNFNLMFSTQLGTVADAQQKIWLRPETAQGMFVNFKNICDTMRVKLPFGLAQVGKAFRNEITPGNFLFRTREFEQMEIQMFVKNDEKTRAEQFEKFEALAEIFWNEVLGLRSDFLRKREHEVDELAHYAARALDFEYEFSWGRGELSGIHDRGIFDLEQHQKFAEKDLQRKDPVTGERGLPAVIELSMGLSRTIVTAMLDAFEEEKYLDGKGQEQTRVVAKFAPSIAPVRCCVIPLLKNNEKMREMAEWVRAGLAEHVVCELDDSGNVGKAYRRQDEIGTPRCVTVDHETLEDGTVTLRNRDTMEQERVKIEELGEKVF